MFWDLVRKRTTSSNKGIDRIENKFEPGNKYEKCVLGRNWRHQGAPCVRIMVFIHN